MDIQVSMTAVFHDVQIGTFDGAQTARLGIRETVINLTEDAVHGLAHGESFTQDDGWALITIRNVMYDEEAEDDAAG